MRYLKAKFDYFIKNCFFQYSLLPIIVLLFIALGWLVVYRQTQALIETNITAYQETELEIVRIVTRTVSLYITHEAEVHGRKNNVAFEQEIFKKFIEPIHLLENGDAWIYAPDHVVFDLSEDFPDIYRGKSMAEIFEIQKNNGASHYEEMTASVTEASEGVGWYIWLPEKGKEIAAWTPVRVGEHVWTIGLSTPLPEILASSGAIKQIHTVNTLMGIGTATILGLLLMWVIGEGRQRQSNKALRESETRYRRLFDSAPDGVSILDKMGNVLECSQSMAKLYGYEHPSDLFGKNISEFLSKDSLKVFREKMPRLQQLEPTEGEIKVIRPDGSVIDIWRKGIPFADKNGNLSGILSYDRDISERVQAENEQKKLYQAVEQSANAVVITDLQGNIEYVNPKFLQISGYSMEEVLGENPRILQSGKHDTAYYEKMWSTISSGKEWHGELCNKTKEGNLFWEQTSIAPIFDTKGKMTNFIAIKEDITQQIYIEGALQRSYRDLERKVKERTIELEESETRYRLLAENTSDFIWIANLKDLVLIYASPSVQQLLGFSPEEILQIPIEKRLSPDSVKIIQQIIEENEDKTRVIEVEMYHKDGHAVWMETTARFLYDDKGKHNALMGAARDISERIRTDEELRRQATTDPLTKIFNRRYFFEVAQSEFERSQRYQRALSIIIFDLDHFKQVNDTYGHGAGDEVLCRLTEECQSSLREHDVFARYGGEEFIILLPETDLEQAAEIAKRIRKYRAETPLDIGLASISLTISFGVASLGDENLPLDELLLRADKALYQAKEAGRNRVILWEKGM